MLTVCLYFLDSITFWLTTMDNKLNLFVSMPFCNLIMRLSLEKTGSRIWEMRSYELKIYAVEGLKSNNSKKNFWQKSNNNCWNNTLMTLLWSRLSFSSSEVKNAGFWSEILAENAISCGFLSRCKEVWSFSWMSKLLSIYPTPEYLITLH